LISRTQTTRRSRTTYHTIYKTSSRCKLLSAPGTFHVQATQPTPKNHTFLEFPVQTFLCTGNLQSPIPPIKHKKCKMKSSRCRLFFAPGTHMVKKNLDDQKKTFTSSSRCTQFLAPGTRLQLTNYKWEHHKHTKNEVLHFWRFGFLKL
jgi:hypothetical protein